jgi:ATP-dependent Lon protease
MSEKVKIVIDKNPEILRLPAVALRGLVAFPGNVIHFEVGRDKQIAAIEWAMNNNNALFLVAQKDMGVEDVRMGDLYTYGVVAEVKQVLRVADDMVKVLVDGKYRAKMVALDAEGRFLSATVKSAPLRGTRAGDPLRTEALVRGVKEAFEEYLALDQRLSKDVIYNILRSDDALFLCDYIPGNLLLKYTDRQALLNEGTVTGRLSKILEMLHLEFWPLKKKFRPKWTSRWIKTSVTIICASKFG